MSWLLVLGATWAVVAVLLALGIGRAVRVADRRQMSGAVPAAPDFVPEEWTVFPTAPR
jgi:hypothetical protein